MLSTAASNALLKTLEEPPGHVVFVLATTDPQKVLPTIRSRTQHFEFRLLGSETSVGAAPPGTQRQPVWPSPTRRSTRRSAGAGDRPATPCRPSTRWRRAASSTTTSRCWPSWPTPWPNATRPGPSWPWPRPSEAGSRPAAPGRRSRRVPPPGLPGHRGGRAREPVGRRPRPGARTPARRMGLPALVRSLEELGQAQVDMRDIPDQRVHLEVALIKLTHPAGRRLHQPPCSSGSSAWNAPWPRAAAPERGPPTETSPARTLEAPPAPTGGPPPTRAAARPDGDGAQPPAPAAASSAGVGTPTRPTPPGSQNPTRRCRERARAGPADPRRGQAPERLGRRSPRADAPAGAGTSGAAPRPARAGDGRPRAADAVGAPRRPRRPGAGTVATVPSRDELVQVWGDGLLASLPNRARARFRVGRFIDVDGGDRRLRSAQRDAPLLLRRGPPRRGGGPGDAFRDAGAHPAGGRRRGRRRARSAAARRPPAPRRRRRRPPSPEAGDRRSRRPCRRAARSSTRRRRSPICSTPPCWRPRPSWPAPGSPPRNG